MDEENGFRIDQGFRRIRRLWPPNLVISWLKKNESNSDRARVISSGVGSSSVGRGVGGPSDRASAAVYPNVRTFRGNRIRQADRLRKDWDCGQPWAHVGIFAAFGVRLRGTGQFQICPRSWVGIFEAAQYHETLLVVDMGGVPV